ncbi:MAG: winged helix-turn-helix domain-containing protein [Candidatus Thorarchaeota archaeon]|nr:winged helix-turn-helix domain-containing protein [Candidatus Thorarchaeota archaeon]
MTGCSYLVALVQTDGKEDEEAMIDYFGTILGLVQAGQIVTSSNRLYFVNVEYESAHDLKELATFFRSNKHVTHLELHTIPIQRGEKFTVKRIHLLVLKQLLEDARMPVNKIAEQLGITSRRVNRALQEMQESNAFWFSVRWNLSLGNNTEFYLKIHYNEKTSSKEDADAWLRDSYPSEYWFSFYSAMEPVLFAKFVTEHFRDAGPITRKVKGTSFCDSVDVLLSYPVRKFTRIGTLRIQEMICEAGL